MQVCQACARLRLAIPLLLLYNVAEKCLSDGGMKPSLLR